MLLYSLPNPSPQILESSWKIQESRSCTPYFGIALAHYASKISKREEFIKQTHNSL